MILNHKCFECGFICEVEVKDKKVICPQCGTRNDVWLKGEELPLNHRKEKLKSYDYFLLPRM